MAGFRISSQGEASKAVSEDYQRTGPEGERKVNAKERKLRY